MVDLHARQQAIDPSGSYIVQAPAGSGKTELLIQRYLGLLATVNQPEEILAITFTRKATEEMRARIGAALWAATRSPDGELLPHEALTRQLAQAVLAQDAKKSWQLLDFPRRLRISTIDAFCANLVRQMPFLSRMGSFPDLLDPATPLYLGAVERMLAQAHHNTSLRARLKELLGHMDNDWRSVSERLESALASRDQWLEKVVVGRQDPTAMRQAMTAFLEKQVARKIEDLESRLTVEDWCRIQALAIYARVNDATNAWYADFADVDPVRPKVGFEGFSSLKDLVWKASGGLRKKPDAKWGFPKISDAECAGTEFTSGKEAKAAFANLVEDLCASGFTEELLALGSYPPPYYTDEQWQMVETLMDVLFHLAVHLRQVNKERNQVDYVEMSLAALTALGSSDEPTDLLLALDHQIHHILIDEFQDTSKSQVALLRNLVSGWLPQDGRTLFVVGDPMQSIYAFRKADVGNFLRARKDGVGEVPLEPLQLQQNFRSEPEIVGWVNEVFSNVFPKKEDVILGQVSYSASTARGVPSEIQRVTTHFLESKSLKEESKRAFDIIQQRLAQGLPEGEKIAVLVRSRNLLRELIPMLQTGKVRFAAVDIFRLEHEPLIQDLQALTAALHRANDDVAWLALLRSPLCGLTLADLTKVCAEPPPFYLEKVASVLKSKSLEASSHRRLQLFFETLNRHRARQTEKSLRAFVEGLFYDLGGPGLYTAQELQAGELFFQTLENLEAAHGGFAPAQLKRLLAQLRAPSHDVDAPVQLMTLHKSKGLEFDTVLLFGLGASPGHDGYDLLAHFEWRVSEQEEGLLLAPVHKKGDEADPVQKFIRHLKKAQLANELQRLLYVGVTRAKKHLHLLGQASRKKDGEISLASGSFLEMLWPTLERLGKANLEVSEAAVMEEVSQEPWLRRREATCVVPRPPATPTGQALQETASDERAKVYAAGAMARNVGTVIHGYLEWMSETGTAFWTTKRIEEERSFIENRLLSLGTSLDLIEEGAGRVRGALEFIINDDKAKWFLSEHLESQSECAWSMRQENGEVKNYVVDRTFVDDTGRRWIIDYKTGEHRGEELETFLEAQQKEYEAQLNNYAKIFKAVEDRPISLALYFPFEGGWKAWPYEAGSN